MFGLCLDIPPVSVSDTALMDNVNQERHSSIESEDKSEGKSRLAHRRAHHFHGLYLSP
jgi:hypothetical protein